jgi:Ca2+-binding RTX toxin-like protein
MRRNLLVVYDLLEGANRQGSLYEIYAEALLVHLEGQRDLTAYVTPETLDYVLSRLDGPPPAWMQRLGRALKLPEGYVCSADFCINGTASGLLNAILSSAAGRTSQKLVWGELEAIELRYANQHGLTIVCFNASSYSKANHPENSASIITVSQFLNESATEAQLHQMLHAEAIGAVEAVEAVAKEAIEAGPVAHCSTERFELTDLAPLEDDLIAPGSPAGLREAQLQAHTQTHAQGGHVQAEVATDSGQTELQAALQTELWDEPRAWREPDLLDLAPDDWRLLTRQILFLVMSQVLLTYLLRSGLLDDFLSLPLLEGQLDGRPQLEGSEFTTPELAQLGQAQVIGAQVFEQLFELRLSWENPGNLSNLGKRVQPDLPDLIEAVGRSSANLETAARQTAARLSQTPQAPGFGDNLQSTKASADPANWQPLDQGFDPEFDQTARPDDLFAVLIEPVDQNQNQNQNPNQNVDQNNSQNINNKVSKDSNNNTISNLDEGDIVEPIVRVPSNPNRPIRQPIRQPERQPEGGQSDRGPTRPDPQLPIQPVDELPPVVPTRPDPDQPPALPSPALPFVPFGPLVPDVVIPSPNSTWNPAGFGQNNQNNQNTENNQNNQLLVSLDSSDMTGNVVVPILSQQVSVEGFGGVGPGVAPTREVLSAVDTLRFTGAGLIVENMVLNVRGNDLVIGFESEESGESESDQPLATQVTLKNFQLQNLDNLSTETWASVTAGNILFDGQSTIQDSFDVIDPERPITEVLRPNTVTFLNALANQTQGFDNASDTIDGLAGDDQLAGLGGNDKLRGDRGNDQLFGDDGDDYLLGGAGDDLLAGGEGQDLLKGGEGRDRFVVAQLEQLEQLEMSAIESDTIQDFQMGQDRLVWASSNPDPTSFNQISAQIVGSNTILLYQDQTLVTLLDVQTSNPATLFDEL